jgi:ornithine cyclodeaminase/alanine dehydrogenase
MTLILTHSDIAKLIDRRTVFEAVEAGHRDLSAGVATNPAPRILELSNGCTVLPMTAAVVGHGLSSVKMLSDMPFNSGTALPTQRSTIMVMSTRTGACEAILDGRLITAIRTAAASAVATAHMARTSSTTLGLVGAGTLAVEHTRAIARIRPIEKVAVWSRTSSTMGEFENRIADLDLEVEQVDSPSAVFTASDIVCTLTPSREPIVEGSWFRPGQHINAVGAPPRGDYREIDGPGMAAGRLVVDSREAALAKSGDVLLAISEGHLSKDDITVELGDVILDPSRGRRDDHDITLFNSVGMGLQDLVTARTILEAAREQNIGTDVNMGA